MKTTLVRVLSLALTVAMLLSLAACKPEKDPQKNPGKKPDKDKTTITQQDDFADSSLSGDLGDIDLEPEDDEQFDIIIARPVTDLGISTGVKLAFSDGEEEENMGEEFEEEEFEEIEDEEVTYVSPVSAFGSAVEGNDRNFSVDNSKGGIIHTNFHKLGCNAFPTMFTLFAQTADERKTSDQTEKVAYIELNAKRFNDIKASYARSWFQIDWMMTNKAGEDYKKYKDNPEQNPDYIAYNKGEYDFNNEYMQSCIKYWRMLGDAGTEIEVSFGWKIAERIQDWFGEDPSRPRISAPKDLDRYADAAKEMFIYCYEQGLTNVNILSYYNEPQQIEDSTWRDSWDYATVGDKRVYWGQMALLARKALDSDKRTKHVTIWGAEPVGAARAKNFSENYINVYLYKYYSDIIDVLTFHEYYSAYIGSPNTEGHYANFYETAGKARGFYKDTTLAVTEFYAASRDVPDTTWGYNWEKYGGWNSSYCSYLIALANNGWHTGLSWGFVGGWVGDPGYGLIGDAVSINDMTGDRVHMAWSFPRSVESAGWVRNNFYNISLLNNYIPDYANVHNMKFEGEDLHASAFTSKDGKDFSLLIEKNEGSDALNFKVKLEKSLEGKDINVFRFSYESSPKETPRNIQATIPELYDTIANVKTSFSYTEKAAEKGKYTVYIFTTLKPLAQLELYNADTGAQAVASELKVNEQGSISIKPTLIDCPAGTKVEWEIKEYCVMPTSKGQLQTLKTEIANADLGTISVSGNTVTYTPAADAKNGDVVALRGTIKGTNRFASAMIHIVK